VIKCPIHIKVLGISGVVLQKETPVEKKALILGYPLKNLKKNIRFCWLYLPISVLIVEAMNIGLILGLMIKTHMLFDVNVTDVTGPEPIVPI